MGECAVSLYVTGLMIVLIFHIVIAWCGTASPMLMEALPCRASIFEISARIDTPELDSLCCYRIHPEEPEVLNYDSVRQAIGYPALAKEYDITGEVVVRVWVDTIGNVSEYKIIKKVHPILSAAVEKHIMKLRFRPYVISGKAQSFWANVPFRFIGLY